MAPGVGPGAIFEGEHRRGDVQKQSSDLGERARLIWNQGQRAVDKPVVNMMREPQRHPRQEQLSARHRPRFTERPDETRRNQRSHKRETDADAQRPGPRDLERLAEQRHALAHAHGREEE